MGIFSAIGDAFNNLGEWLVNLIVDGLDWVTAKLDEIHGKIIAALATALDKPWQALMIIVGSVVLQIALSELWKVLQQIDLVKKTLAFFNNIKNLFKQIASFAQIDTILTILQITAIVNGEWAEEWSRIFKSMGALSQTLKRDFSFVTGFLEINKSILYTSYTLSGNAWIESQLAYAKLSTTWFQNIEKNLERYGANPEQIFVDIQNAIATQRTGELDEDVGKLMAALDYAGNWIRDSGTAIVSTLKDIESWVDSQPEEIQTAIADWYQPLKDRFDTFVSDQWLVWVSKYEGITATIQQELLWHGVDIEKLQEQIDSPADFFALLLMKDKPERDDQLSTMETVTTTLQVEQRIEIEARLGSLPEMVEQAVSATSEGETPIEIPTIEDIQPMDLPISPPSDRNDWFVGEGAMLIHPIGAQRADKRSWYVGE